MFKNSYTNPNLRNKYQKVDHKGKTDRNRQTFASNAVHLYNNLPANLKQRDITPKLFKKMIKAHIITENHLQQH